MTPSVSVGEGTRCLRQADTLSRNRGLTVEDDLWRSSLFGQKDLRESKEIPPVSQIQSQLHVDLEGQMIIRREERCLSYEGA